MYDMDRWEAIEPETRRIEMGRLKAVNGLKRSRYLHAAQACVFSVENYSEIHFIKLVLGYKLGEKQIKC